jgi:CBS domain-containing protein
MRVREGMNPIVVTIGPDHTLREAARRMTKCNVGAAVIMDAEQSGPGIITERDLLRSGGQDQDLDQEQVRDHLADRIIYADPDWSLETAAEHMTRGGFRHVIVLERGEPIGILSMRDIVRCWLRQGSIQGVEAITLQ